MRCSRFSVPSEIRSKYHRMFFRVSCLAGVASRGCSLRRGPSTEDQQPINSDRFQTDNPRFHRHRFEQDVDEFGSSRSGQGIRFPDGPDGHTRCCTNTYAMPVLAGIPARSAEIDSSPPAEAPMPTIGKDILFPQF